MERKGTSSLETNPNTLCISCESLLGVPKFGELSLSVLESEVVGGDVQVAFSVVLFKYGVMLFCLGLQFARESTFLIGKRDALIAFFALTPTTHDPTDSSRSQFPGRSSWRGPQARFSASSGDPYLLGTELPSPFVIH